MIAVLLVLSGAAAFMIRGERRRRCPCCARSPRAALVVAARRDGDRGRRQRQPGPGELDRRRTARLASQSNRYAYWRVAAERVRRPPARTASAPAPSRSSGSQRRDIDEGVRDAHSLYLETAAELGLVGLAALARLPRRDRRLAAPARAADARRRPRGVRAPRGARLGLGAPGARPHRAAGAAKLPPKSNKLGCAVPADVVTPPPGNPRFPMLDPLRAIAALSVVVTHTAAARRLQQGARARRLDGPAGQRRRDLLRAVARSCSTGRSCAARLDGRDRPRGAGATRAAGRCASCPRTGWRCSCSGCSTPQHTPGVFGDQWWVYWGLLQSWSKETIIQGVGVAWSLVGRGRVLRRCCRSTPR